MKYCYREDISGFRVRWNADYARAAVEAGHWPNRTVADYARDRVLTHPNRVLIIESDRALTCQRLWDEAQALAGYFTHLGLVPGDVISYQLPPWYETNVINLAAALTGLVLHPILSIYRDFEITQMLREVRSKLVFVPGVYRQFDFLGMIQRLSAQLAEPPEIVTVRHPEPPGSSYEEISSKPNKGGPWLTVDPDAVKLILFTSGTTGRAKGVLHTHNTIHADGAKIAPILGLTPSDMTFSPSPVGHLTGACWAHSMPWFWDVPCVLLDRWHASTAFDLIKTHGCTFVPAATPFLQDLVREAKARNDTLESLKLWAIGGAAVPSQLVYESMKVFPHLFAFRIFGATEVPTMTGPPLSRDARMAAETDGRLIGCETKIIGQSTGNLVADGEEGEIACREPSMSLGYLRMEDNESAYDSDGFFKMGDLVRKVGQEHIVVTGRSKDLIIRSGENISPKEIEDVLFNHPKIDEVAIVAMSSAKTGEAICAFVVSRAGEPVTQQEVAEFLKKAGLAPQKTPEHVEIIDELPKTPSGKVQKHKLREYARRFAR